MTEVEREGQALASVLADLDRAMGGAAYRTVSKIAPPRMGDALDKTVRGFEHGARGVRNALAARELDDAFVAQMEKTITEVMDDYQKTGARLSTWWLDWLLRYRDELQRATRADRETEVERGLGHASG